MLKIGQLETVESLIAESSMKTKEGYKQLYTIYDWNTTKTKFKLVFKVNGRVQRLFYNSGFTAVDVFNLL